MSEPSSLAPPPVADIQEIFRRSELTPEEVKKEMRAERKAAKVARDRRKKEQDDQRREVQKIEKPWLFETENPMWDPPDINFRRLIIDDLDKIDRLLKHEPLHFRERCLEYEKHDTWVEYMMLREYSDWAQAMLKVETGKDNRQVFFEELDEDLSNDVSEVSEKWWKFGHRRAEGGEWPSGDVHLGACNCSECLAGEEHVKRRHEELERASQTKPMTVLKIGVAGCVCEKCHTARDNRTRHKGLKREERLRGNNAFQNGVPGCRCSACMRVFVNLYRLKHNELKRQAWLRGISNLEDASRTAIVVDAIGELG